MHAPCDNTADADEFSICTEVTANRLRHSIRRGGVEVLLPRQLFAMFLLIAKAKHGTTPERLFDAIYADSVDGGPLTGHKAMQVQRVNLNRRIAPLYLHITSGGAGRAGGIYALAVLPMNRNADSWREASVTAAE